MADEKMKWKKGDVRTVSKGKKRKRKVKAG